MPGIDERIEGSDSVSSADGKRLVVSARTNESSRESCRYQRLSAVTSELSPNATGRNAVSPWAIPIAGWKQVLLRTWSEATDDNIGLIAAGVAFYGFLALVPLLGAIVLSYGLLAEP